jgi:hypothetical protein
MQNLTESAKALRELLSQRILVLDGAVGTMLQQANLTGADFGGVALEGCNENLVRTRPDVVLDIQPSIIRMACIFPWVTRRKVLLDGAPKPLRRAAKIHNRKSA